jgi:copper(I)-binding protein
MRKLILSAALALIATPVLAANVTVVNGWFRALPAGLPSGGYFMIENAGEHDAVLTAASSAACGMLMLHKSENNNGMASMMDMPSVAVPAGGAVSFKPGGYHLMCMQPTAAMKPGVSVPVTLQFADGSKMTASFAVRDAKGQ